MKKLFEIVKLRKEAETELSNARDNFKKQEDLLIKKLDELIRLENLGGKNIDVEKIQLAENVISVNGDPYGRADSYLGKTIADYAIEDIANGCQHLRTQFFGNKRYESFYQRCDCEYGYGPRHGYIVDRIELRDPSKFELTPDEKDACIYYLKNYNIIKENQLA